jgi:16S rRNA (cytidine1402-2'-O)-methyltransferase
MSLVQIDKPHVCREMTKRYEETIRGNLKELSTWATSNEVLGEITLVIAGAVTDFASLTAADMVARVREFESAGMDRKGAIGQRLLMNLASQSASFMPRSSMRIR